MSDGAHLGVGAARALGTILGGEDQPTEEEQTTPANILDNIREAPTDPKDYDNCAMSYARVLLEAYEKYPALRALPCEAACLYDQAGNIVVTEDGSLVKLSDSIYDVLKALHPDENCWQRKVMSDLTGFMVGWAHNAVRYGLGDPPVPNPAIVEVG